MVRLMKTTRIWWWQPIKALQPSDISEQYSEEYGFRLGDAFASGGSRMVMTIKKMGITACGGWEFRSHFREIGG